MPGITLMKRKSEEGTSLTKKRPASGKNAKRNKPDKRSRQMRIVTEKGFEPTTVRGSTKAKTLARYTSAVGHFLRTGETDRLSRFENREINGFPLITDPDTLTELAHAGALELDELYVHPEQTR
jgi:hypothetical protein